MSNRPVYPIGIIAELLSVHPETIRVWERNGVIKPKRRSGKRYYSDNDLKRLHFIQRLVSQSLNLPAIRHFLQLYPCWQMDDCPGCMKRSYDVSCAKPCWQEENTYCHVSENEDSCLNCKLRKQQEQPKAATIDLNT